MDQGLPQSADPSPPTDPAQCPILYQDVWLKDKSQVEFSEPPSTPQPRSRKVSLREYLDWGSTSADSETAIDNPHGNGGAWELSLSTPSFDWEHMVDQLNQDPHADSMTDSGQGMVSME